MSLDVRSAVLADVPSLQALIHSAYRGDSSRAGWTHEADYLDGNRIDEDMIRADIDNPASTVMVVEDHDGLLGTCVVIDHGDGRFYFGTFAVRPTAQGKGVGDALLAHAETFARSRGAAVMEMTVVSRRTELIAWYVRRGYTDTGETRPFPYGDERFGVPRVDDLEFTVLRKPL